MDFAAAARFLQGKISPADISFAEKVLPTIESPVDMSAQDKNAAKRGPGTGSTSDIHTIIPLLFAAHPQLMPDYRKMALLDDYGRTNYALEHKFRKWRIASRRILEDHPEVAVEGSGMTAKKGRKSKAKGGNSEGEGSPMVSLGYNAYYLVSRADLVLEFWQKARC